MDNYYIAKMCTNCIIFQPLIRADSNKKSPPLKYKGDFPTYCGSEQNITNIFCQWLIVKSSLFTGGSKQQSSSPCLSLSIALLNTQLKKNHMSNIFLSICLDCSVYTWKQSMLECPKMPRQGRSISLFSRAQFFVKIHYSCC